jgi:hypothetical protein
MVSFFVRMMLLLLCCNVLSPCALAQNQQEVPFGLAWGQTISQVQGLGVDLKPFDSKDYGKSFVATGLPRALADQETALLSFGHDDRLWRIVAAGRKNDHDPSGATVRSRYDELRSILEEKYGKSKSVHRLGDSIYSKPENFVYGLREGNSFWFSSFDSGNIAVELGIIALDMSTTRWRIIFEDKALSRQFENSKRSLEKKAL